MKVVTYVELKKVCGVCGNEYEARQRNQRYCSKKCRKRYDYLIRKEQYAQNSKKYYAKFREKFKKKRAERYWANPEKWRKATRDYYKVRKNQKHKVDEIYKDKVRHGGKRKELLDANGYVCSQCGKLCESFHIIAHHTTFNPKDHHSQELLCRSCHASLHNPKN